jgi:hypothetical protein
MNSRYAVVRWGATMTFSKWHTSYEDAKKEAERLCRKEKVSFKVLKEVANCSIEEIPVKWEEVLQEGTLSHS